MSLQESAFSILSGNRWKYFHAIYTLIYGVFSLRDIYVFWYLKGVFFPQVTNILVLSCFILTASLWFKRTRGGALKYLLLPIFGLMWSVFTVRLGFEIFAGTQWLSILTKGFGLDMSIIRAGDVLVHFLTLFVGYQIIHVYEEEIEAVYAKTATILKLLLAYSPYFIILLWSQFYDPFLTYGIPDTVITQFLFYAVPPLLLTYTYTIYRTIVKPDDEVRRVLKGFRLLVLGLIASILGLGVYLFGWSNLYVSLISWISIGLMIFIVLRLYFGSRMLFATVFLFPLYGLIMGFYFVREVVFSWLDGNQQFFLALIQPGIVNGELLYTIYMLLTYICLAPVIGEIFIMEVPYRLNRHTLLKRVMLRQRHQLGERAWLHELWNGYGAVIILVLYLFVGGGAQRYFPEQPLWESVLYSVMGMTIVCAIFPHMLYRRYIKRAEGL